MSASLLEILSTTFTTRVVRREAGINNYLLQYFGFQPGGFAETVHGHRDFGYDIFNDTRTVTQGSAPGTPARTVTRQKVGRVNGTFPRFYEKLHLLSEQLHNLRPLGGPSSTFDERGIQYAIRQQRYLGQRLGNLRMLLLAGMFRGTMYAHKAGDDIYYDFTSTNALFSLKWQKPADCLTQLPYNGGSNIIGTTWANTSANIPSDLSALNAALQSVTGTSLETIICGYDIWQAVVKNTYVQAQAGTSNPPFTIYERIEGYNPGTGRKQTVIRGRIAAVPWIDWIITDEGVKIGAPGSETFTKFIPSNTFWWGPTPNPEFFEMLLGGEPVNEGRGQPEQVRNGAFAWTVPHADPAGQMLYSLDNCIPADYIPLSNGLATAIF